MRRADLRNDIADGIKAGLPIVISAAPFGLLFGALAVKNGFSPSEAVLMSATVYAGASQMVGLELFGQKIAPWMVAFSIFAVNFRHVLYSAAVGRRISDWPAPARWIGFFFLVDPQFAETERRSERFGHVSIPWYFAMALTIYVTWVIEGWLGARFGALMTDPHAYGIDFLLPVYFLGMVMGFRSRPLWLPVVGASAVMSILAYRFVGSPWHVSLGALAGVMLAAALPPAKDA